jgi:formate C-acetyltransferase
MHMVLHNGVDINGKQTGLKTGDPRDFKCFEDMYQAFLKQHKFLCHRIFWLGNVALQVEPKYMRLPFLSSISIQACMDKGQDLLIPDPDYAMFGVTDRAIIDAADSMMAVKKLVFEDKKLTMDELMNALDSNFAGERGEEIRMLCLRQPKYGNDIPEIDELVRRLSDDSGEIIHSYDNSPYRRYMVAREGLAWHYYGGLGAGALPDGRKALEPLNDGSLSPMRGVDKHGPTAVLRSAITAGFDDSYASVLNQKFSSAILASPDSVDKLIDYTDAFMSEGGTHIQYNIVDTAQLKDAKAHPENYSDLIVRIGGFSAYFTQLSPSIQDDVINRSEFNL